VSQERRFDPAKLAKLDSPERRARMPPAAIVAALELTPRARVADVGAGSGYVTFALLDAESRPSRVHAVDVSQPMLGELRRRLAEHAHGGVVETRLAPAENLPLDAASVDRVVLGNVFHELDDPAGALAEARRVLAPSGRILILDWERPDGARGAADIGPPYEHRVAKRDVEGALRAAGFADIRSHPGFRDVYAVSALRQESLNVG
jgi:ubiquinone/menaquinone biosynthesis C-methylase UbiE